MTCAQCKAKRQFARIDPRYAKQGRRDVGARDARFRAQMQRQKDMATRRGSKGRAA